jgi:hypothetical protein
MTDCLDAEAGLDVVGRAIDDKASTTESHFDHPFGKNTPKPGIRGRPPA